MAILAETIDAVIGVDTHTDTHTACLLDGAGREIATVTVEATPAGYRQLLDWAARLASGPQLVWAVEGCRSHGAGLARVLQAAGQSVIEAGRPERVSRRPGGKSDPADARLAARTVLAAAHHAQPRGDGDREALRILLVARDHANHTRTAAINVFKALLLTAPDHLREPLRRLSTPRQTAACAALRAHARHTATDRALRQTLRGLARQIRLLEQEIRANTKQIQEVVAAVMPALLAEPGVGPSALRSCLSHGHIRVAAARRRRLPRWLVSVRCKPPPAASRDTGSTASATAPSTVPCTPSLTGA